MDSHIQYIKLSELTALIERVVKDAFAEKTYWIIAEISGLNYYQEKNYYFFDLVEKDETTNALLTSIKANAWGSSVSKIKDFERATGQKFTSNIQVLVKVSVEYTVKYGLKLNFIDIDHSYTIGNLEKQRQETLKKLLAENPEHIQLVNGEYITFNKKVPINPVIQHIALISSANAEGYKDFRKVLAENQYKYFFIIDEYLAQVQGESAAQQMVNRLVEIYESHKPYDAVVIVRGGGTPIDFLHFDSYLLSKAVARFPIPIITGIGHSGNQSIVDLMANNPTIAPTKAAEYIIAHNRSFEEKVINFQKSIISKTNELTARHQIFLNNVNSKIIAKTKDILSENTQNLSHIIAVIVTGTNNFLIHHKERIIPLLNKIIQKTVLMIDGSQFYLNKYIYTINSSAVHLLSERQYNLNYYINLIRHLSPTNVLKRGYSLIYQNGKIVTDPSKLQRGNEITNLLYDTEIISTVKDKKKSNEPRFKL